MFSRDHQNEVDAAHALLRAPDGRRRTFGDVTFIYAPNRPGRPSPKQGTRRPLVDFRAGDLLVGTLLRRSFKGVEHVVYIVPPPADAPESWRRRGWGRYVYRGERHKSLTSIAHLIVGDADPRISGNRFFGLRRRRDRWFDDGLRWTAPPKVRRESTLYPSIVYQPDLIVSSGRHRYRPAARKAAKMVPSKTRPEDEPPPELLSVKSARRTAAGIVARLTPKNTERKG